MSEVPRGRPDVLATRARVRGPAGSTRCPGRLGPRPKALRCQPDVPDHSRLRPRLRGVDQLSWATGAWSEGAWCQTGVPGNSGPCLKARVVDQLSQALGPVSEGTWVRPGVPGDRTRVRRPVGSTICPGRYWPGSKGPRGPPAGPRDSGPVLMARGVNQQSLAPGARVRNPSVLTSCPGRLETVPEGLGVEQLCQGTHT